MVARKGDPCPLAEDGKVCGKPVNARGMCAMHYWRLKQHGDPFYQTRRYVKQGDECDHETCFNKPKRLGYCEKHAKLFVKYGETTDPRERRFWAKVNKNGPTPSHRPDLGPCWVWEGYIDSNGYGQFGGNGNGSNLPHRIAYQYLVGPIGKGLHLDHVCRNRACVNALGDHLEPVTPRENIRRGDQGAFWGYEPEVIPPKAPKPTVCTECGRTDKPVFKSGLCRPCYRKRAKNPDRERPEPLTAEGRFWLKVDKNGPVPAHRPDLGPCWLWTASINKTTGYGQFAISHGVQVQTHRYSYEMANESIPEKHDVHHECHVRRCINPAHLSALSRSDNLKLRKNRRD